MTNEEKANALAKDYLLGHDRGNITYEEMLGACLEMAEWKDQQFKEYLSNIVKAYKCKGEKFFFKEIAAIEIIIDELKEKNYE